MLVTLELGPGLDLLDQRGRHSTASMKGAHIRSSHGSVATTMTSQGWYLTDAPAERQDIGVRGPDDRYIS